MNLIESDEAEAARLAEAPEGSLNHFLSTLPVTIREDPRGFIVKLPSPDTEQWVTVVPIEYHKSTPERVEGTTIRQDGWWTVVVVASEHPSYPVGGYDLSVPYAQIRRGARVKL